MSHTPITATQLAQGAHVSKETGTQLALVTDPYHDYTLVASGYPDGSSVYSVVKRRSGRTTITCPFTLGAGETWDFHVFTTPLHDYESFRTGNYLGGAYNDTASGSITIGPVNVMCRHYSPLGAILNMMMIDFNVQDLVATNCQARTISLGFEIHDQSAELDKQGTIATYRVNQPPKTVFGYKTPGTIFPFHHLGTVPSSLSEILINPTNRTWELKYGAYVVSLPSPENTYNFQAASNFVLPIPTNTGLFNSVYSEVSTLQRIDSWSPILCGGAMSSRLPSAITSYLVDFRQIVEILPSPSSPEMVYAIAAPAYNNQFLKLYKEMIITIPSGTKVGNNASGDWFRAIAGIARTVAPLVTSVLPPQAKMIASLAGPLANMALQKVEDRLTQGNNKSSADKAASKKNGKT